MASATEFFRALWRDAVGFAELRLIGGGKPIRQQFFEYPAGVEALVRQAQAESGGANVYYGVCLRNREEGKSDAVSQATCLWADIDFKTTPESQAMQALRDLPRKASIGVLSGAGIHAYWLLREPVTGDDLARVPKTNRAIAKAIGGDRTQDLARILRVPGTLNTKYTPPRPCEIAVWRPELTYTLEDFDFLPTDAQVSLPAENLTQIEQLSGDMISKLVQVAQKLWVQGHRHEAALFLGGMLAKRGIPEEVARRIVQTVATLTGDEEVDDRIRAIQTTYEKLRTGTPTAGYSGLQELAQRLPEPLRKLGLSAVRRVNTLLRPEDSDGGIAVIGLIKHDTRPVLWETTIALGDRHLTVKSDTETQMTIKRFRRLCWEEHHTMLPSIRQESWEKALAAAPIEVRRVDAAEATADGYLIQHIEEFEERAQPERAGEAAIQAVPIRLDTGEIVLRLTALLRYLRTEGIENRQRERVIAALRALEYEPKRIRLGPSRQIRAWVRRGGASGGGGGQDTETKKPLYIQPKILDF